jgi:hypothetical protein
MKVIYRFYEPNQGLEEVQAKIFNFNMENLETYDQRGDPEEIRKRYEFNLTDPKQVRFAFTEEGEPLAYIQSRINQNKTISIGYPWAMPKCPSEVQEKIFDELFNYIKDKKKPKEINYWLFYKWREQIDFFERKGFSKKIEGYRYEFDVLETSKLDLLNNNHYRSRLATDDDLGLLLEVSLLDKDMNNAGFTEKWLRSYFTEKVLKDGHCILVFKNDQIVCSSAPLRFKENNKEIIILRFTATKPGNEKAWLPLISHITQECLRIGWNDVPLRVNTSSDSKIADILKTLNPKIKPSYHFYIYEY